MDCICTSNKLFNFGCRCGAFKFEHSDHIWFNGIIYSIGKTEEEARFLSRSYLEEFDEFDPDWLNGEGWKIIPDDKPLALLVTDESDEQETRFAHEWIKYYGPGFLAAI